MYAGLIKLAQFNAAAASVLFQVVYIILYGELGS